MNNSWLTIEREGERVILKKCSKEAVGKVNIPDGVTEINGCAFMGCTSIKTITIPNSVTKIGSGAFYGCTGLNNVYIPGNVTTIDPNDGILPISR